MINFTKKLTLIEWAKLPTVCLENKNNSFEALRLLIIDLLKKDKRSEIMAALKKFEATKLSDLADDPASLKKLGSKLRKIKF